MKQIFLFYLFSFGFSLSVTSKEIKNSSFYEENKTNTENTSSIVTNSSKRNASSDNPAIDYLIQLFQNQGIKIDDYDYLQNTILPLYTYTMYDRNVPADLDNISNWVVRDTIAHAPHDGCFFGIGDDRNTYVPSGIDCETCNAQGGTVKTSGSYPWGMTMVGNTIFWGTNNNFLCIPSWQGMTSMGTNTGYQTDCWVCEYAQGVRKDAGNNGDMVRPRVYKYDIDAKVIEDITPENSTLLDDCLGLRSAGNLNGVVFIGGPGLDTDAGQTSTTSAFLAFDTEGHFLAESALSDVDGYTVTDVRRWLVVDNVLYVGVAVNDKKGNPKGAILRWYGDKENPFVFHVVGFTDSEAGEICSHNGRIYAGTWPSSTFPQSAIYEGPELPEGGYTPENAQLWTLKWKISQYEPNALIRRYNQCSMLCSYQGKLYWSMWFPQYGLLAMLSGIHADISSEKGMAQALAMLRQATLWRADTENSNADGTFKDVEMLYGEEKLPNVDLQTGEVSLPSNNVSRYKPVYGRAGFDRLFTSYMWANAVYQDHLYIGTMSTEALIEPAAKINPNYENALNAVASLLGVEEENKGYELYMIKDNDSPAATITQDGFGNHMAYGIRNMLVSNDDKWLYIGTANPMNISKYGGWSILKCRDFNKYPTSIDEIESDSQSQAAGLYVKHATGYVVLSSLLGENLKSVSVYDTAGRLVKNVSPEKTNAYLFPSEIGKGVFVVTVTTESGSYTTKVTL